jgi:mono/diheme cytochrome c family protein
MTHNPSEHSSEAGGEELYANVCQGCHMPDGKGATAAGTYPSLAGDKALEAPGYPLSVVVNGQHGMPPVGIMMNDEQVAAVVNYLRAHFGRGRQCQRRPLRRHVERDHTVAALKVERRGAIHAAVSANLNQVAVSPR